MAMFGYIKSIDGTSGGTIFFPAEEATFTSEENLAAFAEGDDCTFVMTAGKATSVTAV